MAFILRQVTQRAAGSDIVRSRALGPAAPVIGRGSDCDIQIADLAVSLRHATLSAAGRGAVRLEAFPGLSFDLGGRAVARADLRLEAKPVAVFGSHALRFAAEANGDITVTVTQLEGAGEGHGADAAHPARAILGSRALAWSFGGLILLLCLAAPVALFYAGVQPKIRPDRQWSSGPLSAGHAFLSNNCQACHQQAFVAVRDAACKACHVADPGQRVADVRRLGSPFAPHPAPDHAPNALLWQTRKPPADPAGKVAVAFERLFDHPADRCAACHTEHVGSAGERKNVPAPPTPVQLAAGDCADCHDGMQGRLPQTRFADVADWASHSEFRPRLMVAGHAVPVSLSLHRGDDNGLTFSHREHLLADGGVARMAMALGKAAGYGAALDCQSCHRPEGGSFRAIEMVRDCGACHSLAIGPGVSLPHGDTAKAIAALRAMPAGRDILLRSRPGEPRLSTVPAGDAAARVRAIFATGGVCAGCHAVSAPPGTLDFKVAPVTLTARFLPFGDFDHAVPAHRQDLQERATCDSCHKTHDTDKAQTVMLPSISSCRDCHGRRDAPQPAAATCTECHGFHTPGVAADAVKPVALARKP